MKHYIDNQMAQETINKNHNNILKNGINNIQLKDVFSNLINQHLLKSVPVLVPLVFVIMILLAIV